MKRKILQLVTTSGWDGYSYSRLIALSDDGTLWMLKPAESCPNWVRLPALPDIPEALYRSVVDG